MSEGTIAEQYIRSILGQQNPLTISEEVATQSVFRQLLRVDSLFNLGQTAAAKEDLEGVAADSQHRHFREGLEHLLGGDLNAAYSGFVQASKQANGLEAVFYGERAVNIAFWIACSGKMLEAAQDLDIRRQPFAGGVLSFAHYMNGSIEQAEQMARQAMADGFQDPWTLHSIAHCLFPKAKP